MTKVSLLLQLQAMLRSCKAFLVPCSLFWVLVLCQCQEQEDPYDDDEPECKDPCKNRRVTDEEGCFLRESFVWTNDRIDDCDWRCKDHFDVNSSLLLSVEGANSDTTLRKDPCIECERDDDKTSVGDVQCKDPFQTARKCRGKRAVRISSFPSLQFLVHFMHTSCISRGS